MTVLKARPVGRCVAGQILPGSTTARILDVLDTFWGEWIDLDRLVTEYLDRFAGNEETVRRKFYRLVKDPPAHLQVRWVPSKTDRNKNPYRQVFVDNPYLREEDHVA